MGDIMKKYLKIIFFIVILIAVVIIFNYLRIKFAKVEVTLKDNLKLEFNDKKKVSDFIESINGTILDDYIIDSSKLGKKDVIVSFKNDDNIKVKYKYQVEIVDTVSPLVWLNDSYNVKVGSDIDLSKSILCGDNNDNNVKCVVEGLYDLNTAGTYDLVFKAIDNSGNKTVKNFKLNVYEPVISNNNQASDENYNLFEEVKKTYKNKNNKVGIDISSYQGDIDFKKLKNAGVEFVMIRVGYTKGKNDKYILDKKFKQNILNANKYGIKAGVYFYSYADSLKSARRDAKWVIKQIKNYKIDLPVVFDWEEWSNFRDYNLSFFGLTTMAEEFLKTVEKSGYKGMLYSSKNYLENIWMNTDYDIWIAQYNNEVTYKGKYKMWQICENGVLDEIDSYVDIDILYN